MREQKSDVRHKGREKARVIASRNKGGNGKIGVFPTLERRTYLRYFCDKTRGTGALACT